MAGFKDFRPKTQAQNLTSAGTILLQFQKFQNLVIDPQSLEPCKQELLENR